MLDKNLPIILLINISNIAFSNKVAEMCRNLRHYLLYPSKYYYSLVDRINLYHYNCTTIDYFF